ncbi:hypothetical protein AgCh_018367 [Apium graveolens]
MSRASRSSLTKCWFYPDQASLTTQNTVQTTVEDITGLKPLHDYDLLDQIGSVGPGLNWKLYSGKAQKGSSISQQYPMVCVWLLDKRALSEALDESKNAMAIVMPKIWYSIKELFPVAHLQKRRCPWSETSRVNGCPRWETSEYPALCTQKLGITCLGDTLSVKSRSRGRALGLCGWASSADIPKASRRRFPVGFPLGLGTRNLSPLDLVSGYEPQTLLLPNSSVNSYGYRTIVASVANALQNADNIAKVPKELKGMEMSLLVV